MPADDPPTFPPQLQDALNKYRAWEKEQLDREQAESKPTAPLYHYTDARGLRGIFESQTIWFTDYRHLNDPSELLHGLKFARDIARQYRETAHPEAQFFLDQFIYRFRHAPFDDVLEYYIASFSRARNDLDQWRAYADNGRGFAIGFAPHLFEVVEKPPMLKPAEFMSAVKYPEDATALYSPLIAEATQIFLSEAITNAHLMQHDAVKHAFARQLTTSLIATLIWRSLTIKHHAYKHEEEVRLFIPQSLGLSPYVKTRPRGSENVPYIPQPWPVRVPGSVAEIVIGPAAPSDAKQTLREFLSTIGVESNNITHSDIPYRVL
jgi:Protein of unknown function (DUF2971)